MGPREQAGEEPRLWLAQSLAPRPHRMGITAFARAGRSGTARAWTRAGTREASLLEQGCLRSRAGRRVQGQ